MAKLNLIASPVVTDDSILSEDELFPNDVHIEGIAEAPNIEVCDLPAGPRRGYMGPGSGRNINSKTCLR